ncbi:MAG: hypothetical protein ACLFTA_01725 [Candidatus Nanohaloarchaea archaeon]
MKHRMDNYEEIYEKELEDSVDRVLHPFKASELDASMPDKVVSRVLRNVSEDEAYNLEIVDKHPRYFSRNGVKGVKLDYPEETQRIGRRATQVLRHQGTLNEEELNQVIDYLTGEEASLTRLLSRRGEVKDLIREIGAEYDPENQEFNWTK